MPLKDIVSIIKDSAAGLREVALVILLAVLLFNPPVIVGWLKNSQLDKVGMFGISFEARKEAEASRSDTLAIATQVQTTDKQTKEAEARMALLAADLERAKAQISNQASLSPAALASLSKVTKQVESVRNDLAKTRDATRLAQAQAKRVVIAQTQAVQKAGGAVRQEGWVWVGQLDPQSGKLRDVGEPETVVAPKTLDPARLKGGEISFRSATYIYREPFDGADQPSGIIGVAPAGASAKATDARLMRFRREGLPRRDPDDKILWVRIAPD